MKLASIDITGILWFACIQIRIRTHYDAYYYIRVYIGQIMHRSGLLLVHGPDVIIAS